MKRIELQAVNSVVRNGQLDLVRDPMAEVIRSHAPRLFSPVDMQTWRTLCAPAIPMRDFGSLANYAS
jgi:hypothetical protein